MVSARIGPAMSDLTRIDRNQAPNQATDLPVASFPRFEDLEECARRELNAQPAPERGVSHEPS
jgi:hypothetical protein